MKRSIGTILCILCTLLLGTALGAEPDITYQASESARTVVHITVVNGENYLFLPSSAKADALKLHLDTVESVTAEGDNGRTVTFTSGETWDLTSLFSGVPSDGRYRLTLTAEGMEAETLTLLFSENIRSLFLVSDDPAEHGRAWLEDCSLHQNSTTGSATLLRADGSTVYDGALDEIAGRGNSTWRNNVLDGDTEIEVQKKPYQIKLAKKVDLLDTGDGCEANSKWVLLADYYDPTMLHNRISFDLARELGEAESPNCQPVDLYYDGEYRGMYLLTEKVEVNTGRVAVKDYEKILEKLSRVGGVDVDTQAQTTGTNCYGIDFVAVDGVEDGGETNLGGYLLELDQGNYPNEKAYFSLPNGTVFTVRSPQNASAAMVQYLSELFEEINETLNNYGVNAETGKTWTDYLDTDALLPYFWVNELANNPDTWRYSSTYFSLKEGSSLLYAGPVWDFDLAYLQRSTDTDGFSAGAQTLTQTARDWGYLLYCIPEFQTLARDYFTREVAPTVQNILLGDVDTHGVWLHSLTWYWQEEAASRWMNDVLWNPVSIFGSVVTSTYEENFEALRAFLADRTDWLTQEVTAWPGDASAEEITLRITAPYANVADGLSVNVDDVHANVTLVSDTVAQVIAATEEAFATYRVDVTLAPKRNIAIAADAVAVVNGVRVPCVHHEDGTVTVSVLFDDPSYRPAFYGEQDYGLAFNAEDYASRYPEVAAEVGNDPDALLSYYVNTGLAEGQAGNAFLDPKEVLDKTPDVAKEAGENYEDVVYFFLEGGYQDWMSLLNKTFDPDVHAAEN